MTYDGGKNGAGVWQTIINQMPPHRVYIEAFLGSGAVLRRKRPAAINIGLEKDPLTLAAVKTLTAGDHVQLIQCDALDWLKSFAAAEDVLIYADPPYLLETRSCKRDLYRCEFSSRAEHTRLLELAQSSSARWVISGYASSLYSKMLAGWRTVQFQTTARSGGVRTETLWMNYPAPAAIHDYAHLGTDRTDRQRIRRKINRWTSKLLRLPPLERRAVFEACDIAQSNLSRRI